MSPATSASRMRPEEMRSPSSSTWRDRLGGDAVLGAERLAAASTSPLRPLPKLKSSPVTTPAAPIRSASTSATNSSALVHRGSSSPNSNTSIASAPAWANSCSRWSSVVRRNGGTSGLKKRTGCGSKVATIDRPPLVEGARDRAPDHRLVAEVESVEIAECDDAPLKVVGDAAGEGEALHWRGP